MTSIMYKIFSRDETGVRVEYLVEAYLEHRSNIKWAPRSEEPLRDFSLREF